MPPLVLVGSSIAWAYGRGGAAWTRLSWIIGLQRAGADVFVVDQLDRSHRVFRPGDKQTYENALNLGWFDAIVDEFGLAGKAALIGDRGEELRGPGLGELQELASSADALVNLVGFLRVDAIKARARRRIYVDFDPALTHLWLGAGRPAPRLADHHLYFTIGENVGLPECPLPTGGITWRHARQPVLLDYWPVCETPTPWRFTTVSKWRGDGPHGRLSDVGVASTDKADEFIRFAHVAPRSGQRFEIAVDGITDPREAGPLLDAGWVCPTHAWKPAIPNAFAGTCRVREPSSPSRRDRTCRGAQAGSAIGRPGTSRRASQRCSRTRESGEVSPWATG